MPDTETPADVRRAIEAANEQFMDAFRRGDAAGLARLYSEQGQAFPPNGDIAQSRRAIQDVWQAAMDAGIKGARLDTLEVDRHSDTSYEVGKYTLLGEAGSGNCTGTSGIAASRLRARTPDTSDRDETYVRLHIIVPGEA